MFATFDPVRRGILFAVARSTFNAWSLTSEVCWADATDTWDDVEDAEKVDGMSTPNIAMRGVCSSVEGTCAAALTSSPPLARV